MDLSEANPELLLISERGGALRTSLPLILVANDQALICLKIALMRANIPACPLHTIQLFLPDA